MRMHSRHQAHPDRPPHRLRHLPLIHIRQPCRRPRLNPHRRRAKLRHHREILIHIQRIDPQLQERIRPLWPRPPKFILLGGG